MRQIITGPFLDVEKVHFEFSILVHLRTLATHYYVRVKRLALA